MFSKHARGTDHMAASTTWPANFGADAMKAKTQLGKRVIVEKLAPNVGANATRAGALVPDKPFMLQQTWFTSRPNNDTAVNASACAGIPDHVGLWGVGTTTADMLGADGTLVPSTSAPSSTSAHYATLPLFGGPSIAPAFFAFELANLGADTDANATVLLLRAEGLDVAAAPYVLLTPASEATGAQGTAWQYVSRATALSAGAAWGVFRQRASKDDDPRVFLLFTSNAVRAGGAPAALVVPVAVSVTNGVPYTAPVSATTLRTCSAGTPPAFAFSTGGAAVTYDAPSGTLDVKLDASAGFGTDGAALTWQLQRPAPTRTAKEARAARAKDIAVAAIFGCVFLAFAVVLMWAVARKNKGIIAVCSVVCAVSLVCVAAWFTWLRELATPATNL
jgi:hypothetical protein